VVTNYVIESRLKVHFLYLSSLWNRLFLEKLIVADLIKNVLSFFKYEGSFACPKQLTINPILSQIYMF